MNTPTHAAINFLVLGRRPEAPRGWIVLGAVLPDVPMIAFLCFERLVRQESLPRIFGEIYFEPGWQALFSASHSIPLFLLLGLFCGWRRSRTGILFTASLILHSLVDWPTHLEDGHAYFWPILREPMRGVFSYWHPGSRFWLIEVAIIVAALGWLVWERLARRSAFVLPPYAKSIEPPAP